ncbi:MAG: glycerol-3-phosphate 1-O-acyltransferase PlsY [Bacilli bacterium]|jgi:glycerol-3-phosphate acyltransferase PlsY|nr:glycerol-3-phosphate 1-O-acyltransferase PlsY [Bacilli bacterium]
MNIFLNIIFIISGYLVGSIPFALVIGKTFYHTDIRTKGSGNLGGTNMGRTLGKKAGLSVMILDILKAFILVMIAKYLNEIASLNINPYLIGLACVIGHCYPIFAGFKGGKGVACATGLLLALNPILLFIAIVLLVINLKIHHMMSLAVIITVGILVALSFIFNTFDNVKYIVLLLFFFLTYQHRSNIKRIINKEENKVTWI